MTFVAVIAVGYAVYSLVYGVLAVQSGEEHRLVDGILHLVSAFAVLVAGVGAFWLRPGPGLCS